MMTMHSQMPNMTLNRAVSAEDWHRDIDLKQRDEARAPRWHRNIDRRGTPAGYTASLAPLAPHIVSLAKVRPLQLLDCGIGAGHFAAAVAARAYAPVAVTGVDVSAAMLRAAGQRLSALGYDLEGHLADSRRLPFENNSFDMVVSAHMLEHLPAPELAIAQMCRVLRPGGMIILGLTRRSLASVPLQLMWRVNAFTPGKARKLLTRCGFEAARVLPAAGPTAFRRLTLTACASKPLVHQ
ncbi:MAG: class I SAM-dependent methyltransferase [Pseudomonadota bacterium]